MEASWIPGNNSEIKNGHYEHVMELGKYYGNKKWFS
jgi:hypothetical protein